MKRRFDRRRVPLDVLSRTLGELVDVLIGEAVEDAPGADSALKRCLDAGTLAPADLARQAIAAAFRVAYAIVEEAEPAGEALLAEAGETRRPAVERLTQVLRNLPPLELDQDVLGEALARLSTTPFVRHPAVRDHEEARARRAGGSFFTPPAIVERLLDATLEPLLDEIACLETPAERENALLNLAVVDPACGSGRFLLAAVDRIAARLVQARTERGDPACDPNVARANVIERCIYGVDIDPLAIDALRFRLRRAADRALPAIDDRTICGDAISSLDSNGFLYDRSKHSGGFDLAIGNPPWTSYSGRHRGQADDGAIAGLVVRFPEIARWPALHSAMLALSAKIVRDGGRVGLVLPLRMADLDAYADLRAALATRLRLDRPVMDAGESAFPDVVQPAGLFVFRAAPDGSPKSGDPWPIERSGAAHRSLALDAADDDRIEATLAGIERLPKFPPRTFGDPGVHSGNVASKLIVEAPHLDASPIREGRDVIPFACLAPRRGVRTSLPLELGEYCRVGRLERFLETPILLRQTADRPIAARHREPTYFRNSLLACRGVEGISDLTLVAYLNSALYALLHRRSSGDASQKSFPQVKVRALQNLPLPPLGESAAASSSLAEQIERQAALAEQAASGGEPPDRDLLEAIERLILRSFGVSENLAPLLLERVGQARSPSATQLK